MESLGHKTVHKKFFDTVAVQVGAGLTAQQVIDNVRELPYPQSHQFPNITFAISVVHINHSRLCLLPLNRF